MKKTMLKILGGLLAALVSSAIGVAAYFLMPIFTMWFQFEMDFGAFNIVVVACVFFGLALVRVLIPYIPVAIAHAFDVQKNKFLAALCALLMGAAVTVRQIMNWSIYAPDIAGPHIEGGYGWGAVLCIIFPGLVFILVTFLLMAFSEEELKQKGQKLAS